MASVELVAQYQADNTLAHPQGIPYPPPRHTLPRPFLLRSSFPLLDRFFLCEAYSLPLPLPPQTLWLSSLRPTAFLAPYVFRIRGAQPPLWLPPPLEAWQAPQVWPILLPALPAFSGSLWVYFLFPPPRVAIWELIHPQALLTLLFVLPQFFSALREAFLALTLMQHLGPPHQQELVQSSSSFSSSFFSLLFPVHQDNLPSKLKNRPAAHSSSLGFTLVAIAANTVDNFAMALLLSLVDLRFPQDHPIRLFDCWFAQLFAPLLFGSPAQATKSFASMQYLYSYTHSMLTARYLAFEIHLLGCRRDHNLQLHPLYQDSFVRGTWDHHWVAMYLPLHLFRPSSKFTFSSIIVPAFFSSQQALLVSLAFMMSCQCWQK